MDQQTVKERAAGLRRTARLLGVRPPDRGSPTSARIVRRCVETANGLKRELHGLIDGITGDITVPRQDG